MFPSNSSAVIVASPAMSRHRSPAALREKNVKINIPPIENRNKHNTHLWSPSNTNEFPHTPSHTQIFLLSPLCPFHQNLQSNEKTSFVESNTIWIITACQNRKVSQPKEPHAIHHHKQAHNYVVILSCFRTIWTKKERGRGGKYLKLGGGRMWIFHLKVSVRNANIFKKEKEYEVVLYGHRTPFKMGEETCLGFFWTKQIPPPFWEWVGVGWGLWRPNKTKGWGVEHSKGGYILEAWRNNNNFFGLKKIMPTKKHIPVACGCSGHPPSQ